MADRRSIRDKLYRSPAFKTAISIITSVLIGIFSNTLVTEISTPDGLKWALIPRTIFFWALLLSCAAAFQFHRYLLAYETQVSAFGDVDFCIAYVRSQLLPAQVAASVDRISAGDIDQFKAAMKQIKDALK
jgi:hypothetical protein